MERHATLPGMTEKLGPWDSPPPEPPRRRAGRWAWLLVVAGLVGLAAALAHAFPEALRTRNDWWDLVYGGGLAALVASGAARLGRRNLGQAVRHAGIWLVIVAVIALGFAYRDELAGVPAHLRLAFSTGEPVAAGAHELVVPQDDSGSFLLVGRVNGVRVRFMVDTGATDTVLSQDDARRIGIDVAALHYDSPAGTANGVAYGARYVVPRLEVGSIVLTDFPVIINQAPMGVSLLGMSFVRRLDSFEVRGHRLILRGP